MKREFTTHMEAINWLSDHSRNEAHFEIMREELKYNYIASGHYFVDASIMSS